MTEQEIAQLRALIEKATPAPWGHFVLRGEFVSDTPVVTGAIGPLHEMIDDKEAAIKLADADADLMIAAVNNIAALCDEVERLRGACEDAFPVIKYIIEDGWDEAPPASVEFDELDAYKKLRSALGKDE